MNSSLTVSSGGIPAIVSELLPISSQEYSGFPPYKFALKVMASSLSATDLNVADLENLGVQFLGIQEESLRYRKELWRLRDKNAKI